VSDLVKEPNEVLSRISALRQNAGVREHDQRLGYGAPSLNLAPRHSTGENDATHLIDHSELMDILAGNVGTFPRVQALLKHGKVFLKSEDAREFIKAEQSK
jgi:hypothetical protein